MILEIRLWDMSKKSLKEARGFEGERIRVDWRPVREITPKRLAWIEKGENSKEV